MEYQNTTLELPGYDSRVFQFYFKNMKLGVLDIETTGLSPQRNQFILGGLLSISGESCQLHQFFAENLSEEADILSAYLHEISQLDYLLTYNGKHFDVPFLQKRGGASWAHLPYNLDLYLVLNGHSSIKKFLPNLKQKTVEAFMGLWNDRTDEISGKESVDLYYSYLQKKDPQVKEKILLHNRDDVLQLYRLLPVLEKANLHKALYHLGFPVSASQDQTPALIVDKILFSASTLTVSGRQVKRPAAYILYESLENPCSAIFDGQNRTFSITAPLIRKNGLAIADIQGCGLDTQPFEKYPSYGSGFLVLEDHNVKNFLEINHFVKLVLERILDHGL